MSGKAVIGVDLGGTNVRVGKVQNDRLVQHFSRPISGGETEEVVMREIMETIDRVFDRETVGIGVGVPSVVDVEKGIVYSVVNIPSWRKVYLRDRLQEKYRVPVFINNDANCFALGESYFGKGLEFRNVVGLIVGTGLGAGVIIDSHLYNGSNCGAGEFGHIPYKEHDFEYYCSGQWFSRGFGVRGEVLYERAQNGDAEALRIFEFFGLDLGNVVKAILYAVDPEIIVFGGSVSKAFSFFEKGMRKTLESFNYQHALERLVLVPTEMKEIAVLGAAALYFDAQ
ncbi:MAG: ROK family protein [bacterium]|nr:ROK family protein [bacterium]